MLSTFRNIFLLAIIYLPLYGSDFTFKHDSRQLHIYITHRNGLHIQDNNKEASPNVVRSCASLFEYDAPITCLDELDARNTTMLNKLRTTSGKKCHAYVVDRNFKSVAQVDDTCNYAELHQSLTELFGNNKFNQARSHINNGQQCHPALLEMIKLVLGRNLAIMRSGLTSITHSSTTWQEYTSLVKKSIQTTRSGEGVRDFIDFAPSWIDSIKNDCLNELYLFLYVEMCSYLERMPSDVKVLYLAIRLDELLTIDVLSNVINIIKNQTNKYTTFDYPEDIARSMLKKHKNDKIKMQKNMPIFRFLWHERQKRLFGAPLWLNRTPTEDDLKKFKEDASRQVKILDSAWNEILEPYLEATLIAYGNLDEFETVLSELDKRWLGANIAQRVLNISNRYNIDVRTEKIENIMQSLNSKLLTRVTTRKNPTILINGAANRVIDSIYSSLAISGYTNASVENCNAWQQKQLGWSLDGNRCVIIDIDGKILDRLDGDISTESITNALLRCGVAKFRDIYNTNNTDTCKHSLLVSKRIENSLVALSVSPKHANFNEKHNIITELSQLLECIFLDTCPETIINAVTKQIFDSSRYEINVRELVTTKSKPWINIISDRLQSNPNSIKLLETWCALAAAANIDYKSVMPQLECAAPWKYNTNYMECIYSTTIYALMALEKYDAAIGLFKEISTNYYSLSNRLNTDKTIRTDTYTSMVKEFIYACSMLGKYEKIDTILKLWQDNGGDVDTLNTLKTYAESIDKKSK